MSKRRSLAPDDEEEEGDEPRETAKERRERREREARAQKKRGRAIGAFGTLPRWKIALSVVVAAVAVVVAIVVILVYFPGPCLSLETPPATSGVPDESAPSWCVNSTAAIVESMAVHLTITVGGTPVSIPGGVGEINQAKWGWACDMPVFTDNSTGAGVNSGGEILIDSPWNFTYTLADFFNLWKESYSTVTIGSTAEPVSYTGTQLFNYTGTTTQPVRLWVDGQLNTAGPNLVLNYLADNYDTGSETPGCFTKHYGTGHSIVLTWGWEGAGEAVPGEELHEIAGETATPLPASPVPVDAPATAATLLATAPGGSALPAGGAFLATGDALRGG